MLIGAVLMVVSGEVAVSDAYAAINMDVILFLFGMFSIVSAMEVSGLLHWIAFRLFTFAKTPERVLAATIFGMGVLSAFFVNDTIALLWTPVSIQIAKQIGLRLPPLLIALAFGITIGSVMTPIGNPQNLLIAVQSGISLPFLSFLRYLAIPTLVNLGLTYLFLKWYYRKDLARAKAKEVHVILEEHLRKPALARISGSIAALTLAGFVITEGLRLAGINGALRLSTVAMIGGAAIYIFSRERREILKHLDWGVLVFFASMFVVVQGVWSSGLVNDILRFLPPPTPAERAYVLPGIMLTSIALSQVLSNVPFVALYSAVMRGAGFDGAHLQPWLMLAAGSTIAGNLSLLAAASNVIIVEAAEARHAKAFSFGEFMKVGAPVTALNALVYLAFLLV